MLTLNYVCEDFFSHVLRESINDSKYSTTKNVVFAGTLDNIGRDEIEQWIKDNCEGLVIMNHPKRSGFNESVMWYTFVGFSDPRAAFAFKLVWEKPYPDEWHIWKKG